jgi:hypothetical protein
VRPSSRTADRRLAALEAAAGRLLDRTPGEFNPLRWLTVGELARVERWLEAAGDGATLPDDFTRRALGRALLNVDMIDLDRRERASGVLLRFDHPDRPGDRMSTLYIAATEDPLEPGRWHLEDWYLRRWPSLPAELTTAEVDRLSVGPWPPRVPARDPR